MPVSDIQGLSEGCISLNTYIRYIAEIHRYLIEHSDVKVTILHKRRKSYVVSHYKPTDTTTRIVQKTVFDREHTDYLKELLDPYNPIDRIIITIRGKKKIQIAPYKK